jgi:hypothetical protein
MRTPSQVVPLPPAVSIRSHPNAAVRRYADMQPTPARDRVDMSATFAHRALETHSEVLVDGRTVALRHTVPSDAPRLSVTFGPSHDVMWGRDVVAFDDHGAIVGYASAAGDVAVVPGWQDAGLDDCLRPT